MQAGPGFKRRCGGILMYADDFKPGTNTQIGAEDSLEMGSNNYLL